MHIGVDLLPLASPRTGIGNYEFHLLDSMLRSGKAPAIEGFGRLRWATVDADYLNSQNLAPQAALRQIPALRRLRDCYPLRAIFSKVRGKAFKSGFKRRSLSLFHAFGYVAPAMVTEPIIPVVYDLSFIRFPDMHPRSRVRSLALLGQQIRRAPAVHTISHFSAREITSVYGVETSRVKVIYPGVNPVFRCVPTYSKSVLAHHALHAHEYFMAVSTLEPRKNLRTLISAYGRLPKSVRQRFPLCIVGASGWNSLNLPQDTASLEREGSVRFFGYVSDADLACLYENTRAMMYPSIYEGFGMPIIEALACGAPVVCSNVSAMPEAGGLVVRTVDPFDVPAWTEEFLQALDEFEPSHKPVRQNHAFQFAWERSALQVIDLYAEVVA